MPAELRALLGPRWALVGDTLVLVAPVEERKLRLMYRTGPRGGIWDATVVDGTLRAVLRNKATVVLSARENGTITWTSADKSRTLTGVLVPFDAD